MNISLKKRGLLTRTLAVILIIIAVIFLLNVFQKQTRSFFYFLSSPAQKFFWKIGNNVSDFVFAFIRVQATGREMEELKFRNQELESEISVLKEIKKENDSLRVALGLELNKDFNLSLANIIEKDVSQDYILVDKGSSAGILKDMAVISPQKTLVGKITQVYKNFSKVLLITNPKSSFDAQIQDKEISGLIRGQGLSKIILDLVPRDKNISQGDVVVTSGLGGIFPSGILVGQVKNVKINDVEPFPLVEVIPISDINTLNALFIIIGKK